MMKVADFGLARDVYKNQEYVKQTPVRNKHKIYIYIDPYTENVYFLFLASVCSSFTVACLQAILFLCFYGCATLGESKKVTRVHKKKIK